MDKRLFHEKFAIICAETQIIPANINRALTHSQSDKQSLHLHLFGDVYNFTHTLPIQK